MQNVLIFHQMLPKFLIHPHSMISYVFEGIKLQKDLCIEQEKQEGRRERIWLALGNTEQCPSLRQKHCRELEYIYKSFLNTILIYSYRGWVRKVIEQWVWNSAGEHLSKGLGFYLFQVPKQVGWGESQYHSAISKLQIIWNSCRHTGVSEPCNSLPLHILACKGKLPEVISSRLKDNVLAVELGTI